MAKVLVRVEEGMGTVILAISGRVASRGNSKGLRCFIEPLKWGVAGAPTPCDVDWGNREGDETWEQYAEKIQSKAGPLGVAHGRSRIHGLISYVPASGSMLLSTACRWLSGRCTPWTAQSASHSLRYSLRNFLSGQLGKLMKHSLS